MKNHFTNKELCELQGLPLKHKITRSLERIDEFHNDHDGKIFVSFSGGKDSTVLLHLVRTNFPDVKGVFVNTGLEYPEIIQFVKEVPNVETLKPEKSFRKHIQENGYPVVSKKVSQIVHRFQNPTSANVLSRTKCLNKKNGGTYFLSEKWRFLRNAPFKVSAACCDELKKKPLKKYKKESGMYPIVGVMAAEGGPRERSYLKYGCFANNGEQLRPIGFWTEDNIWEYIKKFNLDYAKIYDKGESRTGCMFCMFNIHNDSIPNRFQRMKEHHPAQYRYCIEKLGFKHVCEYMGIPFE
jgi:3'-phosphoadenosine 5'-phosphosulfate sulfotransferase (PAPS reductase)/FAD synthetase